MKTTEEDNKTLIQDYYKYYGLAKIKDKNKVLKNQKLFQILKTPKKDKASDMGNYNEVKPKAMYMADLLFLPNDNGYKYCLVVVDVGSGITDAEPLRDKTSKAVLIGFKKIFTRGILDEPEYMIQCDSGGEFKNVVSEYFEKMGVYVKYGKAGRSRQMGLVESRNKQLALLLMQRMLAEELITQKVSRHWVDDLKVAITEINKIAKTKKKSKVCTSLS
jgi:hypothetical protein